MKRAIFLDDTRTIQQVADRINEESHISGYSVTDIVYHGNSVTLKINGVFHVVTLAVNWFEFNRVISLFVPDFISFDHDLGERVPSGYDCAREFVRTIQTKHTEATFNYTVHSMNPIGKKNIEAYLESFLRVYPKHKGEL